MIWKYGKWTNHMWRLLFVDYGLSLCVLFCFLNYKIQFQYFQFLESPVILPVKQSMTQTGLQRLFSQKLQWKRMWSQTWSYLRSFEISLYPTPSWAVRFTLKLIREVHFTGFPALKGAVCFADMVWFCWNCDRSWTFSRVAGVEPASCASCCGAGNALLGGYMVPGQLGTQTAVGLRILASQDLWLRSRLPSH